MVKTLLVFCDGTGMDGALAPPSTSRSYQWQSMLYVKANYLKNLQVRFKIAQRLFCKAKVSEFVGSVSALCLLDCVNKLQTVSLEIVQIFQSCIHTDGLRTRGWGWG